MSKEKLKKELLQLMNDKKTSPDFEELQKQIKKCDVSGEFLEGCCSPNGDNILHFVVQNCVQFSDLEMVKYLVREKKMKLSKQGSGENSVLSSAVLRLLSVRKKMKNGKSGSKSASLSFWVMKKVIFALFIFAEPCDLVDAWEEVENEYEFLPCGMLKGKFSSFYGDLEALLELHHEFLKTQQQEEREEDGEDEFPSDEEVEPGEFPTTEQSPKPLSLRSSQVRQRGEMNGMWMQMEETKSRLRKVQEAYDETKTTLIEMTKERDIWKIQAEKAETHLDKEERKWVKEKEVLESNIQELKDESKKTNRGQVFREEEFQGKIDNLHAQTVRLKKELKLKKKELREQQKVVVEKDKKKEKKAEEEPKKKVEKKKIEKEERNQCFQAYTPCMMFPEDENENDPT